MKKLLRILALLVLLVGMAVSASAASALVLDQADLLRPQEEKVLQQSLDQVSQKYQVRLAVVTVKSTGNVKPGEFANVMLDKIKDSKLKGNMVLLLSMKDRDWYISTDNGMRKMITDKAGIKALSGKFLPALKMNNVMPALEAGVYLDRDSFQLEENADNYLYMTVHRKPKKSRESAKADSTDEDHGGGGGKF